jgi:Flp pilus assembly protein TadG
MRARSTIRRAAHAERGVAMVEFTIIVPLILLLIFGITEVGRAIVCYNALTKALEDGARHAAAYGMLGTTGSVYIDAGLASEIRNLVVYGDAQGGTAPLIEGLQTSQISISVPAPGLIEVSATYPYTPVMGLTLPTFGYGTSPSFAFDLRAAVTMRAL